MSDALETNSIRSSGWKPIPLPLKILSGVFVLWVVGAVLNLTNLMANGLPLFGQFVFGVTVLPFVIYVDVIGPLVFLFALWTRKSWGVKWALAYNGLFILNNMIAFFALREVLGLPQILVPTLVSVIFLAVILWKRAYFAKLA